MPSEPIPKDPVYMSYITRHHAEVVPPSPHRSVSPFRPASGLTYTDLQLQSSRGVYPHFHRPFNDHSRYLAVASGADRGVYRDLPRQPPPPWDGSPPMDYDLVYSRRPASAPSSARRPGSSPAGGGGSSVTGGSGVPPSPSPTLRLDLRGVTLTDNMTTPTGRPCYTVTTLVEADVEAGTPVVAPPEEQGEVEEWRLRRVQTYQVPPSAVGYGSGGVRPFHQDYRHYKYFGFGGCGAKTSWGHNPKYNKMYGELFSGGAGGAGSSREPGVPPLAAQDAPVAPPLQELVGGPRRSLTSAEKALVRQFQWHNYGTEGVPSDPKVTRLLAHVAAGTHPTPRTLRHLKLPADHQQHQHQQGSVTRGSVTSTPQRSQQQQLQHDTSPKQPYHSIIQGEIIESYRTKVDLGRRQSLPGGRSPGSAAKSGNNNTSSSNTTARVATYRQMSSPYAAELNRSPNHGSQSPWHQRYRHYKYAGFAGQGASSSWARNPKYAYMYD